MANAKSTEVSKIVARCRRVGWPVEMATGRQAWLYRITTPSGKRVQIHKSPSDTNWVEVVTDQLDEGGAFTAAEAEWRAANQAERQARIAAARADADARTAKLAAQDRAVQRAAGDLGVFPVDVEWLLTPSPVPQTRTVLMTPEAARKALDTINTSNRKKRDHRTAEFVDIIRAGEWGATHQGAAVDSTGVLQDGQHRFQAIVETGETLPIQLSIGMPPENFRKVDTPMLRTARDAASMRGEVNVGVLTSAARMLILMDLYGADTHARARRTKVSIDRVDARVIECGDELRAAVRRAAQIRRDVKASGAALAAAVYKITTRLPHGDPRPDEFFTQLETGIGVHRTHPVWLLRRLFIRSSRDSRGGMDQWTSYAYILKAWSYAARNKTTANLVWRTNEPYPAEPFLPPPPIAATSMETE